jgi:phosphoglycerate kinase
VKLIAEALQEANTIVWNGPVGAFETKEFSNGTYSVVDLLIESKALTVVGGGDTDRALHEKHAMDKMGYVSTAGGAFLELLEGKTLPAVKALNE